MPFWDYFHRAAPPRQRNLQEGLFQIASQTCSLLVQVNNTNNITFGDNASNIHCNNIHNGSGIAGVDVEGIAKAAAKAATTSFTTTTSTNFSSKQQQDSEQLVVLLPNTSHKSRLHRQGSTIRKPRLSTVLEGPTLSNDEEGELWHHGYVIPSDHDSSPSRRWGSKNGWCRPSCIPISIILILIFLVVLLPVLDQATEKALQKLNKIVTEPINHSCSLKLVESIPEGLTYPNNSITSPSTYDSWLELIEDAEHTIEIASFYWTLRQADVYPDPSSKLGQDVFDALLKVGSASDKRVKIRIAQNAPTQSNPNTDTELLSKRKAAEVRSLNFAKLLGGGVLHTKFWIIDRKHFYIGSANMDWRALTQVKEMGIYATNCSCMADDLAKVFEIYWSLGVDGSVIPDKWPKEYDTAINMDHPLNLTVDSDIFQTYLSSSPPPFSPKGRSDDIDAIVNIIRHAEKFVYIAVMDYFPLMIYTPKIKLWPVIDNALRAAAIDNRVEIRLLISWWNHSRPSEDYFLKSLAVITDAYPKVTLSVRRFIVPADNSQQKIPFARVNHNKYMVTDNTAYIGTSNWSGDYFTNTAGVGFVMHDPMYNRNTTQNTIRSDLQAVFERDWNSNYSHPIDQTLH